MTGKCAVWKSPLFADRLWRIGFQEGSTEKALAPPYDCLGNYPASWSDRRTTRDERRWAAWLKVPIRVYDRYRPDGRYCRG